MQHALCTKHGCTTRSTIIDHEVYSYSLRDHDTLQHEGCKHHSSSARTLQIFLLTSLSPKIKTANDPGQAIRIRSATCNTRYSSPHSSLPLPVPRSTRRKCARTPGARATLLAMAQRPPRTCATRRRWYASVIGRVTHSPPTNMRAHIPPSRLGTASARPARSRPCSMLPSPPSFINASKRISSALTRAWPCQPARTSAPRRA